MSDSLQPLILDLLEWLGAKPRAYSAVIEAWGTSCPRLPVWEEANDRDFVKRHHDTDLGAVVSVTALGREFLREHRPSAPVEWTDRR